MPSASPDAPSSSDVGGVIDYQAPRYAPKANITIAGQTAPGDGVTLYGNGLSFSGSHNNICRFLRVRQGINGDSGTDAMGIANGHDMIFDHITVLVGARRNLFHQRQHHEHHHPVLHHFAGPADALGGRADPDRTAA